MFRTKILIGCAVAFGFAVWTAGTTLGQMLSCISCGEPVGVLRLGFILLTCIAVTILATIVFVRTFRAEVREGDAAHKKYRDKHAPPWAQQ